MNPECKGGKHANCNGRAWDYERDEIMVCMCPCHDAPIPA